MSETTTRTVRFLPSVAAVAALIVCLIACLTAGCDRKDSGSETDQAATAEQPRREGAKPGTEPDDHGEEEHAEEHAEEHGHHDVHLGAKMHEFSRRFSAIWFAGKAGNRPMVDYQVHEMEEVIEALEETSPVENGVDVAERLETDIGSRLDGLKAAVGSEDGAFEENYREIMEKCGDCHVQTNHGFIRPKIPEYNPYPNLSMEP